MDNFEADLTEGVWYIQTNGATYQVQEIQENGDYIAEGTNYEGVYCLANVFGNIKDEDVLTGIREATEAEIQKALSVQ